jgi:hypothetical protein
MKFISHRGNLNGKDLSKENNPEQIDYCISLGFDVEIDIRFMNDRFYLGHDEAQYEISFQWIIDRQEKLWIHCKNLDSLVRLRNLAYINCFWHQEDDFTLTSQGFIWTYPKKELTIDSIAVLPECYLHINNIKQLKCYGICSDFIKEYI